MLREEAESGPARTERSSRPGVSVVLPVHGSGTLLRELDRRIRAALPDRTLEIVMVDDASPDDSLAVMQELNVVRVALPERVGQNAAILQGVRKASQPITCVMDADLEDPPEALPRLLERLARGDADVVFSTRDTASPATSRAFRWVLRRIFPSLPARPCLCFSMNDRAKSALLSPSSDGHYVVALLGALGVPTASVSVRRETRRAGRSAYGTIRRWRYASWAVSSAVRLRWKGAGLPW